ncbi:MAG: transglutaminase N-terminal domain-containing protein, partial [Phenylobacterium sp.]
MLLEIRHVTRYQYDEPVRESLMELWMQPQKRTEQRLISFELEVDPAAQLFSYADTFGNAVYHFDIPQPHERMTIVARSAVETQDLPALP